MLMIISAKHFLAKLDTTFVQVCCKHALFHGLKSVHHEHAAEWSALDQVAIKNAKSHKLEKSIYCHDTKLKVPTQETIYKSLLLHEKQEQQQATACKENLSATAEFVNIGLNIEWTQRIIQDSVKIHEEHPVDHTQQDIDKHHEKLKGQLKLFHQKQQQLTPQVLAYTNSISNSPINVPNNKEYLPENMDTLHGESNILA
ncbi:hypothetical protein EDD85DRAFT_959601 [Armillaria nabsnona]|nr:hypothetical protein EDD85DRAFT_959601 [Armillaria nabsnona]